MEYRRIGVLAGIVSALGFVVQYAPSTVINRLVDGGPGGVIPMVGTTGQTVTIYALIGGSIGSLVTFLLAIGFGYYVSRHLDVTREYRRFGGVVTGGSLVSVGILWAIRMYGVRSTSMDAIGILLSLAVFVRMVAAVSLVVTVGAFAGAALSHFQTSEKTPVRPSNADTEDSSVTRESTTDSSDAHSSSV